MLFQAQDKVMTLFKIRQTIDQILRLSKHKTINLSETIVSPAMSQVTINQLLIYLN